MNLQKLFEAQAVLDAHIKSEHPVQENENRLAKKILALQVEFGECANEWRGFKFWSRNQVPRNYDVRCHACKGVGHFVDFNKNEDCMYCNGTGVQEKNPLLVEYVDCLHFILSIGLELDVQPKMDWDDICHWDDDIINLFLDFNIKIQDLRHWENDEAWIELFEDFYILGKMLGFTWEQIEQAYFDKNQTNHERQNSGY